MTLIVSRSHVCQKYKLQIVLFDSHDKMWVYVMISVWPDGRLSEYGRNFNGAIFSDTFIMINVKLCMVVLLLQL